MSQHFLLSTAAKTLSLASVARLSDEEAFETFRQIRWSSTQGEAVCPRCGGVECYAFKARKIFKCKACKHQFSVTSTGKPGGIVGGLARAASLSPERRREIAVVAAGVRWNKRQLTK